MLARVDSAGELGIISGGLQPQISWLLQLCAPTHWILAMYVVQIVVLGHIYSFHVILAVSTPTVPLLLRLFIHSFIHSLKIYQVHLLCDRHCSECWGNSREWHRKGPCSEGTCMHIAVFQVLWREININVNIYLGVGLLQVRRC